jgi:hypothetical protein
VDHLPNVEGREFDGLVVRCAPDGGA